MISVMISVIFRLFRVVSHGIEISKNVRWRVVADQINSFSPDHSPHVHVVTHIDGTANTVASRPHQLKIEMHTQSKALSGPLTFLGACS